MRRSGMRLIRSRKICTATTRFNPVCTVSEGTMGASMGKVFNANSDDVQGTGQSVGDLKNIGYSNQDIQTMGGGQPSFGIGLARNLLRGGLQGTSQGLQRRPMPYGAPTGMNPSGVNNTNPFYGQ